MYQPILKVSNKEFWSDMPIEDIVTRTREGHVTGKAM